MRNHSISKNNLLEAHIISLSENRYDLISLEESEKLLEKLREISTRTSEYPSFLEGYSVGFEFIYGFEDKVVIEKNFALLDLSEVDNSLAEAGYIHEFPIAIVSFEGDRITFQDFDTDVNQRLSRHLKEHNSFEIYEYLPVNLSTMTAFQIMKSFNSFLDYYESEVLRLFKLFQKTSLYFSKEFDCGVVSYQFVD